MCTTSNISVLFDMMLLRFGCVGFLECKILHEYPNVCSFCVCYLVKIETHVQQDIPFACLADAVNLIECALK